MLIVMEQLASQLTRLHELHLRGGLSDQEFEQAKSLLLQLQPQTPPKDTVVVPAKTSPAEPLVTEMSTFHHKHALWSFIATAVTILAFIIHCAGWRYTQGNGLISLALIFCGSLFFLIGKHHMDQITVQKKARMLALRQELDKLPKSVRPIIKITRPINRRTLPS